MKHSLLRKGRLFMVTAAFASAFAVLSACGGGGGSYEAPTPTQPSNAWWNGYDVSAETLVSADTAVQWIKNGWKTSEGHPVIIVDVQTDFTGASDRIIGSIRGNSAVINGFALDEYRAEGPIDTIDARATSARMVTSGATMDKMIQDMGVTKDTVIVFTNQAVSASEFNLTRAWWTFFYWGFSESKIKILDGGVAAVKALDATLVDTTTVSADPADSTFSVKQLPALHDAARVTTKNVIDLVRAGSSSTKIIDVRGTDAQGSVAFNGRIKGAVTGITAASFISGGKFVDKATGEAILAARGITSASNIVVHCVSGYSATPVYYYIKEVLGYPNVALYDGSWSAWSSHAGYERGVSYASQAVYWGGSSFYWYTDTASVTAVGSPNGATADSTGVIALGGPLKANANSNVLSFDTFRLSTAAPVVTAGNVSTVAQTATMAATTNWKDVYGALLFVSNPDYTGTGNEIEETDKAYIASDDDDGSGSDDDSDEPVSPGGPSGC